MPRKRDAGPDQRTLDFIRQAEVGDLKRLQNALKSRKFEIDADAYGVTALMKACGAGQLEAVKLLVSKGAGMWCVGPREDPRNPLMWAAYEGRLDVIRYFVEEVGVGLDDLNQQAGRSGFKTAMDFALERGDGHDQERSDHKYQVLAYLREKGARFGEGVTDPAVVFEAAAQGDAHYVLYCLVSCPTNLTTRYGSDAYSLLHVAANAGHLELAAVLLAYKIAVEARDRAGRTPLMMAAQGGHEAVVRLLMEHDARIDACDLDGATALHMACFSGHTGCVRALLSRPALDRPSEAAVSLLSRRDGANYTPLARAFSGGVHLAIIRYCLGILDGAIDPVASGKSKQSFRDSIVAQEAIAAHQQALERGDALELKRLAEEPLAPGKKPPPTSKPSLITRARSRGRSLMSDHSAPGGAGDAAAATAAAALPNALTVTSVAQSDSVDSSMVLQEEELADKVGKSLERRTTQFRIIPRQPAAGTLRVSRFLEALRPVLWGYESDVVEVISRADLMQAGGMPTYETAKRAGWLLPIDNIPQGAQVLFLSHRHYSPAFPDKGNSTFSQVYKFLLTEAAGGLTDYVWIDFACLPPLDRGTHEFRRYMTAAVTALLRCNTFLALPAAVELRSPPGAEIDPKGSETLVEVLGEDVEGGAALGEDEAVAGPAGAPGLGLGLAPARQNGQGKQHRHRSAESSSPEKLSRRSSSAGRVEGSSGSGYEGRENGVASRTNNNNNRKKSERSLGNAGKRGSASALKTTATANGGTPSRSNLRAANGVRRGNSSGANGANGAPTGAIHRNVSFPAADEKDPDGDLGHEDVAPYDDSDEDSENSEDEEGGNGRSKGARNNASGKNGDGKDAERAPLEAVEGAAVVESPEQEPAAQLQLYSDFLDFLSRGWVQFEASLALLLGLDMHLCIRWGLKMTFQQVLLEPRNAADGTQEQGPGFRGAAIAAAAKVAPDVDDDPDLWEKVVRVFGSGTFPEDPSIKTSAAIANMMARCDEPQQLLGPLVAAATALYDEGQVTRFLGGAMEPLEVVSSLSRPAVDQLKASFVAPGNLTYDDDRDTLVRLYLVALSYMMGYLGAPDLLEAETAARPSGVLLAGKPPARLRQELIEAKARIAELESANHRLSVTRPLTPPASNAAPVAPGGGGCNCVVM